MVKKEKNGVIYFEFEHFAKVGLVNHCFSSRIGGVSKEPFTSLNLAYHMGDHPADVDENFKLICEAVGFNREKVRMTKQIHQAGIYVVESESPVPEGIDSLITAIPDDVLTTYYADCVPLLFLDPVKKVIANSHAGWRGTLAEISKKTVARMVEEFESRPQDILVGIGPSISFKYFEVGCEVAEAFKQQLSLVTPYLHQKSDEKWHIDLLAINYKLLIEAGVLEKNIEVSNLCTVENPDVFYSHRRDGSARGNMVAMIALKTK